jgi:hypothetical protein
MSKEIKNRIGIILYLLAGIRIAVELYFSSVTAVWFDEIYSMVFAFRPIKEIISLTAKDVHPPLYYIILRLFLLASDRIFPSLAVEQVGKIVSIIPFFLILIYALTLVRKQFGFIISGLFFFCVCSMPQDNMTDIRMYGWALFFITGLGLHFNNIITAFFNRKNGKVSNYIFILLYSVSAIYTHYFAAIAVFWIYFVALVIMFIGYLKSGESDSEKNRTCLLHVVKPVVIGIVAVLCYIPWISVLLSQLGDVKESYWIAPLGPKTPYNTAMHIVRAHYPSIVIGTLLSIIFISFVAFLVFKECSMAKKGQCESVRNLYLFSILPLVALTGYAVSFIMRPIFIDRYLLPSIGLFWLSICLMIKRIINENFDNSINFSFESFVLCYLVIFMLLNASVDLMSSYNYEQRVKNREHEFTEMLSKIDEDAVIITNLDHIQGVVSYLSNIERKVMWQSGRTNQIADYKIYLYGPEEKLLLSEVLPGFCYIEDKDEIEDFVNDGRKVLFMQYTGDEDVSVNMNDLYDLDLNFDFIGSYLFEGYNVRIYSVGQ